MKCQNIVRCFAPLVCAALWLAPLATAEEVYTEGFLQYAIRDGEITVLEYYGSEAELVLPETIAEYPVVAISGGAFDGCSSLTTLTIPSTMKTIASDALSGAVNLAVIHNESQAVADALSGLGAAVDNQYPQYAPADIWQQPAETPPAGNAAASAATPIPAEAAAPQESKASAPPQLTQPPVAAPVQTQNANLQIDGGEIREDGALVQTVTVEAPSPQAVSTEATYTAGEPTGESPQGTEGKTEGPVTATQAEPQKAPRYGMLPVYLTLAALAVILAEVGSRILKKQNSQPAIRRKRK